MTLLKLFVRLFNIPFYKSLSFILLLGMLQACGGGGGGSAPEPTDTPPVEDPPVEDPPAEDPPAEDPPVEDTPVEDTPAEDPPVEDTPVEDTPAEDPPVEDAPVETILPTATLETPQLQNIISPLSTIIINGTAQDNSGVASVTVNGEQATLSEETLEDNIVRVSWSITSNVPEGETQYIVSVEDINGNVQENAASFTASSLQPSFQKITVDEPSSRIIGLITNDQSAQYDYANNVYTRFSNSLGAPSSQNNCFNPLTNSIVFFGFANDMSTFSLQSIRLEEGASRSTLGTSTLPIPDDFTVENISFDTPVCDFNEGKMYVSVLLSNSDLQSRSAIYEISLGDTISSRVIVEDPGNEAQFGSHALSLDGDQLVIVNRSATDRFTVYNTTTDESTSTVTADNFRENRPIAADLEAERIYTIGTNGGIVAVDTQTGESTLISTSQAINAFNLNNARSINRLSAENALIVDPGQLEPIVHVDLTTGAHREFFAQHIGTGPSFTGGSQELVISEDARTAYIADVNDSRPSDRLIAVDLTTGDRRTIAEFPDVRTVFALQVDEQEQIAYASFWNTLYKVDIATGEPEVFAMSEISGDGAFLIEDMVLDKPNNRMIAIDGARRLSNRVLAFDLTTGEQTTLSASGERGEGTPFGSVANISISSDPSIVYVLDRTLNGVIEVDLLSGDRTMLFEGCPDASGDNLTNFNFFSFGDMEYSSSENALYFFNLGGFRYDLDDALCENVSTGLLRAATLTPQNNIFALASRSLRLFDLTVDQEIIVSQ